MSEENTAWTEENSRFFINYARYFVPDRDTQTHILCSLIPDPGEPFEILELACGPGVLAKALLEHFPNCTVTGLDGSHEMLLTARQALSAYGKRFQPGKFDLAAKDWRSDQPRYQAILSSLAIHHLEDVAKAQLFRDLHAMLRPGGALLIADIIRPAGPQGMAYAASAYDDAVRRQVQEIDGNQDTFEQFEREQWNFFRFPNDPLDHPSTLLDQLNWLEQAGYQHVDVFWLRAGHAIFGGYKGNPL